MTIAVTAATLDEFDTFIALYGYSVTETDKAKLLALSFAFLSSVEICTEGDTVQAQCFIAYAMSAEGGLFNPAAIVDEKTLTKKGLGRGAIVKEWTVDSTLSGSDSISMLKRIPMAYSLLKPLICSSALLTGSINNFDVIR